MTQYYAPIPRTCAHRPQNAQRLAGGWCWFDQAVVYQRGAAPRCVSADQLPSDVLDRLTAPRAGVGDLDWSSPRLMGILNVTPDSFSDGGRFLDPAAAEVQAQALIAAGADILDIGGESTRPGAAVVPEDAEIARTAPVIRAARQVPGAHAVPISIDTRKAAVAQAALQAGASVINDVAALTYDPALAAVVAGAQVPLCLMHAQGDPETMQDNPAYEDVLLDVYDFLAARIEVAAQAGIPRNLIWVDPGIGFGKTVQHNLTLLRHIALFHSLGCPILLGASRKRFIGALADVPQAADRMPGSVAVELAAVAQGVQIVRVHDMAATRQALTLWTAQIGDLW